MGLLRGLAAALEDFSEGSGAIQVVVDIHLEPPEDFCVEIISEETVTGRIVTGHKPGSFKVTFEGGDFYYTNFK